MRYIKLNTNESPYPPSPGVISVLSAGETEKLRLYPDPECTELTEKIAKTYGVGAENVITGNGSDELLAFSFLAFCDSGRGVCFPDITYGFYPVYAALYGIPFERVPLREDFTINPGDYCGIGKNIVIANPNAPTGIALHRDSIEAIIRSNPEYVVMIDEAYIDFGGESALALAGKYDNALVLHTFSKSRSLAGGRLAYAIGSVALINDLKTIKYSFNPYNVNRLTQLAGAAALEDAEYYAQNQREIIKTRGYTVAELRKLGFESTDSLANFIFVKHTDFPANMLYKKLKERGILVRYFAKPRISDWLRVTIGTREDMNALICAVCDIFEEARLCEKAK